MNGEVKRLRKSRADRMLDGVCGGIAEYFQLDPTLVRILWVLLTFFGGSGVILYIVAMIIMPPAPITPASIPKPRPTTANMRFWGFLLVTLGGVLLLGNLGLPFWDGWWDFSWEVLLAVLLILAGVMFLFGGRNYLSAPSPQEPLEEGVPGAPPPGLHARLYRSRTEKKIAGVCGGLAAHFSIDPVVVRLLFVVAALASFGVAVIAYLVMAIVIPMEPLVVPGS